MFLFQKGKLYKMYDFPFNEKRAYKKGMGGIYKGVRDLNHHEQPWEEY